MQAVRDWLAQCLWWVAYRLSPPRATSAPAVAAPAPQPAADAAPVVVQPKERPIFSEDDERRLVEYLRLSGMEGPGAEAEARRLIREVDPVYGADQ